MGRLHLDKFVKWKTLKRQMSRDFQGWVDKERPIQWKSTECKARVKIRCELNDKIESHFLIEDLPK